MKVSSELRHIVQNHKKLGVPQKYYDKYNFLRKSEVRLISRVKSHSHLKICNILSIPNIMSFEHIKNFR